MRTIFNIAVFLIISLILVGGCKKDEKVQSQKQPSIPVTTKIISSDEWNNHFLSYDSTSGVLAFSSGGEITSKFKVGDIMVSSTGYGYLRKITGINNNNGQIQVTTVQAALPEAIQNATISFHEILNYSKIARITKNTVGVKIRPYNKNGQIDGIEFPISAVLYDQDGDTNTKDDQIRLEGEFSMTPEIDGRIVLGFLKIDSVLFSYNLKENLNLETTIDLLSFQYDHKINLTTIQFQPILVLVAGLPVVIVPEVALNAGVNVNVQSNVTTSVQQHYDYTVGVLYSNGQWSSFENTNKGFTFTPPTLNATAYGKAYIEPELSFKIYNTFGPYLNADLYGEIDANIHNVPWWTLYAGLDANVGVKGGIFGFSFDYSNKILGIKEKIAEASTLNLSPDIPFDPSPDDNSTDQNTHQNLSWSCVDPENDPLTYDLFLGTSNPPVLLQSGLSFSNYSYDLESNRTFFWSITAKDNHGNSTIGPVWTFSTSSDTVSLQSCPGIPTISYQGKIYNTIQIGNQCWLRNNLNVGDRINSSVQPGDNGIIEKYCYNNDEANCDLTGGLYAWDEAMVYSDISGSQGACPSGWHIPTDEDWKTMETALGMPSNELDLTGWRGDNQGSQLMEGGSAGFDALLGGLFNLGFFNDINNGGYFWTSSSITPTNSWSRSFNILNTKAARYQSLKPNSFSIRCLKNN